MTGGLWMTTPEGSGRGDRFDQLTLRSAQHLKLTGDLMDLFTTMRANAPLLGSSERDVDALWRIWRAQLDEQIGRYEGGNAG